jgi:hypothetical protein
VLFIDGGHNENLGLPRKLWIIAPLKLVPEKVWPSTSNKMDTFARGSSQKRIWRQNAAGTSFWRDGVSFRRPIFFLFTDIGDVESVPWEETTGTIRRRRSSASCRRFQRVSQRNPHWALILKMHSPCLTISSLALESSNRQASAFSPEPFAMALDKRSGAIRMGLDGFLLIMI